MNIVSSSATAPTAANRLYPPGHPALAVTGLCLLTIEKAMSPIVVWWRAPTLNQEDPSIVVHACA